MANPPGRGDIAGNEVIILQANLQMAQLTARNVGAQIVRTLKRRAAAHGCVPRPNTGKSSARRFSRRKRTSPPARKPCVSTSVDSSEVIRADRDRYPAM
jgi:hypothetical protein